MNTIHQTISIQPQLPDDASETGWLIQIHPLDLEQNRVELGAHAMVLGRSPECDIVLDDQSISRQHARIELIPTGHEIVDLGSTNKVRVNDQFVQRHVLRSGDRVQLGDRIFRYLAEGDVETQYHETVYTMMTRDGLTSVFNKRYLLECLEREMARARKHERSLAVILMDIDHFKSINDTHGHLVGDEVLRELARRLADVVDSEQVLARFGGEEFAIIAAECDRADAGALAENCRIAIQEGPFVTSAGALNVTISLGVAALVPDPSDVSETLLVQADERLYVSKREGRNRVTS